MGFRQVAVVAALLFGLSASTIVLNGNGYSNIVFSISEDVEQPQGSAATESMLNQIKELVTETSKVLHKATGNRVYFKSVDILLPRMWDYDAETNNDLSFQLSDIRLSNSTQNSGTLPYTSHSGKCGIAGSHITVPIEFLDSQDSLTVRAKAMVQQWAQFRYGVFEEHGYPNDNLLPYFYRHPEGYDAVVSSNNTIVKGDLETLSGGSCTVDANGTIANQADCRFIPSATDQTATESLMSFHWLETVDQFSSDATHDKRQPHRQNRLCGSKSSSDVIFNLPEIKRVSPNTDNTAPTFRITKNAMKPVIFIAIDKSKQSPENNDKVGLLTAGMNGLFFQVEESHPDAYIAWSTFQGVDTGAGTYLNVEVPISKYTDVAEALYIANSNFQLSSTIETRDVSAVIRDAFSTLQKYKDVGGSILYIVTSTDSETKDTVLEPDMAEKFLVNNIQLAVVESGPGNKALERFSILSQAMYNFKISWETTAMFINVNNAIMAWLSDGLKNERRTILSMTRSVSSGESWTGEFYIDDTVGVNTAVVLQSPNNGSFTVTLTSPNAVQHILTKNASDRNWNDPDSTEGVASKLIDNPSAGKWSYSVRYEKSSCSSCPQQVEVQLQVGSSTRNGSPLPSFYPWVSLTAGTNHVDLSQHPVVVQARFQSNQGLLGGLSVTADIWNSNSQLVTSIPLSDKGTMDSDISKDGVYSGFFYPNADGKYSVSFVVVWGNSASQRNRLLASDQASYCCGSSVSTATMPNFQSTINNALSFEVKNSASSSQASAPIVSDFKVVSTYGQDQGRIYVELTWTVPLYTKSQVVKYSDDYNSLLTDLQAANEARTEYGNLSDVTAGSSVWVYVSAPYNQGKNVYFVVETTGSDNRKTASHLAWSASDAENKPFTPPSPTTTTRPTSTSSITTSSSITSTTLNSTSDPSGTSTSTVSSSTSTDNSSSTSSVTSSITTPATNQTTSTSQSSTTSVTSTSQSSTTSVTSTQSSTSTDTEEPDTETSSTEITTTEPTIKTTPISTSVPTTAKPGGGLTPAEIGYIVGGVVGGIVLIGAVTGGVIYFKKRSANGIAPSGPVPSSSGGQRSTAPVNSPYATLPPYAPSAKPSTNNGQQAMYNGQQPYSKAPVSAIPKTEPSVVKPMANDAPLTQKSHENSAYEIDDDDDGFMTAL